MSFDVLLFYVFGALAVGGGLAMVANVRNTVAAAMSLVIAMIALGGIYVLLGAHLIAVVQLLVYAGAIVVLFVFVVMLLNLQGEEYPPSRGVFLKGVGVVVGAWFLVRFLGVLGTHLPETRSPDPELGSYANLGWALYTDYLLAFEATSLLLLAAIVGAVVLAKRRLDT